MKDPLPLSLTIRSEEIVRSDPERAAHERQGIHAVNEAAFGRPAEADLVDALRENGRLLLSMIAETQTTEKIIVAYVGFSPMTITVPDESIWQPFTENPSKNGVWGMGPVAVLPGFQRQGIGSALVRKSLEVCRVRGVSLIFLLGNPAYYRRFGFRLAVEFGLRWEHGAEDAFQVLELTHEILPPKGGIVRFSPEFDAV